MGAVTRDLHEGERQYETAYPGLHTSTGIKALLRDHTRLRSNAYDKGDYDALLMLIDLQTAIEQAKLTAKQSEALRLVYEEDLTQQMAADVLGVTRETLKTTQSYAEKKIAKIYAEWQEVTE